MENMKEVIALCLEEQGDDPIPESEFIGVHKVSFDDQAAGA
jgi:predicted RNase H-like HicB family nuclease